MKYQITILFLIMVSVLGCSKDIVEDDTKKDSSESVSTDSSSLRGQACTKKEDCKEANEYCFVGTCVSDYPECLSGADCLTGSACVMNTSEVCDGCAGKNLCFVDSFCDGKDFDLTCEMGTIPSPEVDFGTPDLVEQDSSFVDVN